VTVYGSAQYDKSRDFIAEISRKCMYAVLPLVFGRDFILIRHASDKNSPNVNQDLMDRFNMCIELHQLQEIRRGLGLLDQIKRETL
jgi:hypothetical protein